MSSHSRYGFLVCDPQTRCVVRKSRTIPAMTPLEFSVFVVEDKHYHAAHSGDVVDLHWLSSAGSAAWQRAIEVARQVA